MGLWTTKPPFGTPIDTGNSLASGLVAFYALNENTGLPKNVVNGVAGTGGGATWSTGSPADPYLSFDGTSQQITLSDLALNSWTGPMSVVCLCSPATTPVQHIIDSRVGTSQGWFFTVNQPTVGGIGMFLNDGTGGNTIESNTGIVDGAWHTWGVSAASTATNGVTFYRDGVAAGQATTTKLVAATTSATSSIGSNKSGATLLSGGLAWLGVWSRALSGTEQAAATTNIWQVFAGGPTPAALLMGI